MIMTMLTIELPDKLVKEAKDAGLLAPDAMETMLRENLRRCAIDELREAMKRMDKVAEPAPTEEEIQAEIDAVRALRSASRC